jgi:hypothetical protein
VIEIFLADILTCRNLFPANHGTYDGEYGRDCWIVENTLSTDLMVNYEVLARRPAREGEKKIAIAYA